MRALPILLLGGFASAATAQGTISQANWEILPEIEEAVQPTEGLKRGTTVLRQRLVPKRLAIVRGDVEQKNGKDRWAKAGDQLFGAQIYGREAYCILRAKMRIGGAISVFNPGQSSIQKLDCFLDRDEDGKFDQRVMVNPGIGFLPNIAKGSVEGQRPLKPVEFERVDPTAFDPNNWVELEFRDGGGRRDRAPTLRIRYRYDGKTRSITREAVGTEGQYPQTMTVLGSEVVIDRGEDDKLTAQVKTPMDGEFGVAVSIERRPRF